MSKRDDLRGVIRNDEYLEVHKDTLQAHKEVGFKEVPLRKSPNAKAPEDEHIIDEDDKKGLNDGVVVTTPSPAEVVVNNKPVHQDEKKGK